MHTHSKKLQSGFVTLFASLMILLLITINVFIGSKGSVIEQQTANNQYRTEEAFQNAEIGVAKLIADLKALVAADPTVTLIDNTISETGKYTASFISATRTITSTGTGAGNATRTVTQRMIVGGSGNGGPAAINTLGGANFSGNASATSVKSGGGVTFSGSGSVGGSSTTTDNANVFQNTNEFKVSSTTSITGYRAMTGNEYFLYWFGGLCPEAKENNNADACKSEAKSTVTADAEGYICNSNCDTLNDSTLSAQYDLGKRIFWLEGGMNHKLILGSVDDPVLILVMNVADGGDSVHINGNSDINGVLYVDILTKECFCTSNAEVVSTTLSEENDITKPIYSPESSTTPGAIKCTQNSGCKDSFGTKINKNSYYLLSYQKYSTYSLVLGAVVSSLTGTNVDVCTVSACEQDESKCALSTTSPTSVSSVSCDYVANAVGDPTASVEIDITGTWDNSGGGNTLINGATITSGSFTGQGTIEFIKSDAIITNEILNESGGNGFGTPTTISVDPNGWSDIN